jgi:hypothetical protein
MGRFDFFSSIFQRGGRSGAGNAAAGVGATRRATRSVSDADFTTAASKNANVRSAADVTDAAGAERAVNGRTLNGKSATELSVDPDVVDATTSQSSKLAKLGIKGAAGVAALMILTGESNPIAAIEKAYKEVSDAAQDVMGVVGDLLDIFTSYGLYISLSCSCLICMIMLITMAGSAKQAMRGPPPTRFNYY